MKADGATNKNTELALPLCKHDSSLLLRLAINWTDSWRLASNSRHLWTWHPFLLPTNTSSTRPQTSASAANTHFENDNKSRVVHLASSGTFLALCGRRYMLLRNRWGRGELRPRWRRLQTSTTTSTVTLDTHEATLPPRGASVHTAVRGKSQTRVHRFTPACSQTWPTYYSFV